DFIYQISLNRIWPFNSQDVAWCNCTIRQWITGLDKVTVLNCNLTSQWHEVFLNHTLAAFHDNFAVTTLDVTKADHTINFSYYGRIRRITCFEQFRYTRKTPCDILRTSHHTWNLNDYLSTLHFVTCSYADMRTNR